MTCTELDTIAYVVTDQNGLTSTSTRTVIIQSAHTSCERQPSLNHPANDNTPHRLTTAQVAPTEARWILILESAQHFQNARVQVEMALAMLERSATLRIAEE
jgi:hypothetical protein